MNALAATAILLALVLHDPPDQPEEADNGIVAPTSQPSDVIDPELVRKLLGGQSTTVDAMDETLASLDKAADLLSQDLDPGIKTQTTQQDIVTGIDKLIEEARKNRPSTRGGSKQKREREGRPGPRQQSSRRSSGTAAPHPTGEGEAGKGEQGRQADSRKKESSTKSELSRGWGFLPQRDREEISQGFDEQFIEKYRNEIEQYYRALAEQAQQVHENENKD